MTEIIHNTALEISMIAKIFVDLTFELFTASRLRRSSTARLMIALRDMCISSSNFVGFPAQRDGKVGHDFFSAQEIFRNLLPPAVRPTHSRS